MRRGKPRLYQQAKPEMETDIVRRAKQVAERVPLGIKLRAQGLKEGA